MKKIKLIYNPFSGDGTFKDYLDTVISVLQKEYEVHIVRCRGEADIENSLSDIKPGDYDALAVSGGDGTVNRVVNAIIKRNAGVPIGVFSSGTANDFATFLEIPKNIEDAAEIIVAGNTVLSDIGEVNGKYFVNVCGAGHFANISQQVDLRVKSIFGKMAYYLKGLEKIPNFEPIPVRITNSEGSFEEDIYFFIVLNTAGTGGFERLASFASITDGLFEFVAVKAKPFIEMAVLFFKILQGDYLDDPNIVHFRDSYIKVEIRDECDEIFESDIDGELGPKLPVEIRNIKGAVSFFAPPGKTFY